MEEVQEIQEIQNHKSKDQTKSQDFKSKAPKYDLNERLLVFAKRILGLCKKLPRAPECEGIRRQLANSSTSIGANYQEADGALSKKDFINKVGISRREAKETRYWLQIIGGTYYNEKEIRALLIESEEIIKILSAIIRNTNLSLL